MLTLYCQGATERCSIDDLVPLVDTAMSPEYASIKKRMDSFSGWRFTNKADPKKMAEAGFFYTGTFYTFIMMYLCCRLTILLIYNVCGLILLRPKNRTRYMIWLKLCKQSYFFWQVNNKLILFLANCTLALGLNQVEYAYLLTITLDAK